MPERPSANDSSASLCEELKEIDPFSQLSALARGTAADCARLKSFDPGEYIIRQGEVADSLIVILDGIATISIDDRGAALTIANVGRHSVIGEIGLMTGEVRSASVIASTSVRAAIIARDDIQRIADRFPRFQFVIYDLIANHIGRLDIDALCGKELGPYDLERRIGRGGMGVVYRAVKRATGETVAMKMLRHDLTLDRQVAERFHQEAEILRTLNHRSIVCLRDQFFAYGTYFIVMDYCSGPTLSSFIPAHAPLSVDVIRRVLGQLADALLHAHQEGIVHRDLKPSNIIIEPDGFLRLIDFGLARSFELRGAGLTQYGDILGTPRYMAPEQLSGERGNEKSDYFAVGCIAMEMLTGHSIFRSKTINGLKDERANWTLPARESIRPHLPADLYRLLRDSLALQPNDRTLDLHTIATDSAPIDLAALD